MKGQKVASPQTSFGVCSSRMHFSPTGEARQKANCLKNITWPEKETKRTNRKGVCFPKFWPTISASQRSPWKPAQGSEIVGSVKLRKCEHYVRAWNRLSSLGSDSSPFVSIWIAHATEEARGVMGRRKRKGTWRQGTSWSNRPDEMSYFPSLKFHLSPPLIIRHLENGSAVNYWLEKSLLAIFPSV